MRWGFAAVVLLAGASVMMSRAADQKDAIAPDAALAEGERLRKKGDYRDAAEVFRRLTLEQPASDKVVTEAFSGGLASLHQLGNWSNVDKYRNAVAARHPDNPRVLTAAATDLRQSPTYGHIKDGKFVRGEWGEQHLNVFDADRTQALRWLTDAAAIDGRGNDSSSEALATLKQLRETLLWGRYGNTAWRLQELTDYAIIPDYNDPDAHPEPGGRTGWPVNATGDALVYRTPESWDQANNDGERYRWTLTELTRMRPDRQDDQLREYGDFLHQHLGVQTLGGIGWRSSGDDINDDVLSLKTLNDNETIARLATGIRRFTLDDDLNYLAFYKQIKADRIRVDKLSSIYLDRQQYTRAEEALREFTKRGSTGGSLGERYRQIVGNLGQLQPFRSQAYGQPATVNYRFRNGTRVDFTAQIIDVDSMLADWEDAVIGKRDQIGNPFGNLGWYLVHEQPGQPSGKKYVGETVAEWGEDLDPRKSHFDRTITIKTPLKETGVYLVTARMKDGNVSRIVVWLDDLAVMRKPLQANNQYLFYVADAASGEPIPNASIDLFGWRSENRPRKVTTTRDNATTNEQGLVKKTLAERFQWLAIARTKSGRRAFLNPEWLWSMGRYQQNRFSRTTAYGVTDRPIYRPGHEVKTHVWLRDARYDLGNESVHANKPITLELFNPQGDSVWKKQVKLDEFGGTGTDWKIPEDAKLGRYTLRLQSGKRTYSAGNFRVEEYRKPDFEVTIDQPDGAVELGDSFDLTVRAEYYAGGAVSKGTVSIKVERTEYDEVFYPIQPWDWLYANGYGWKWFGGYGHHRFNPWWSPRSGPPELVLQQEVELAADGSAKVTIDTELAKAIFGDQSQKYQVTAEVTDVSRRVVAASGSVVAAAQPFEVSVWSRRGFVQAGDQLPIQVTARRIGGGVVNGEAVVQLIRMTTDAGQVKETEVAAESITLSGGEADTVLPVANAGLYRVVAKVTEDGVTMTGSWEFVARGEANGPVTDQPLTLTADRREYAVGDTAHLLLTTTQPGTQVLVFERPEGGRYTDFTAKQLDGQATLINVPITAADMPNIYVEAVAVVDGELETVVAELFVPPASRALDVVLEASEDEVGPGEDVELTLRAKDADGRPYAGSVAFSVYDRSLDAIAGGGGSGDIRQAFWLWRRGHHVAQSHSLGRSFSETLKRKETRLQHLGRFGGLSDVEQEGELREIASKLRKPRAVRTRSALPMPSAAPMAESDESMALDAAPAAGGFATFGYANDKAKAGEIGGGGYPGAGGAAAEPVAVRESFADTAFWTGVARTDADGVATVSFTMPENLTAWSASAWVVAPGTRVGQSTTGIVTTKDILVRVIAPRFLVETDEVVLSGVVQNQTDSDVTASVNLNVDGGVLRLSSDATQSVTVPANSTARVDWPAIAIGEGEAGLTVTARTDVGSDAMRITLPVSVHGYLRTDSWAGIVRDKPSKSIQVVIPADRRPEQSLLSIRVSPTVAGAIVESLPYLVEYPYGCTEQTLNRFLPAVVTRKTLSDLGVSLEEVAGLTAKLDPNVPDRILKPDAPTAVLSDEKLDDVVSAGIKRLLEMQLSDGGWGWFSGYQERSYPHTTAVVVRGLQRGLAAEADIPEDAVEHGLKWLARYRAEQITRLQNHDKDLKDVPRKRFADHLDALIEMTLAEANRSDDVMRNYLFRDRLKLSPVGLAMVGLAFSNEPDSERFRTLVSNLEQFFVGDAENATAYLETPNRFSYWWWYGDDVEANAYALKLFVKAMPNDPRVSGLARYLLNNRRNATYWKSTRDTAIAVEALNEYLASSGELDANVTLEVVVDGQSRRKVQITRENLFTFDGVVELKADELRSGPHTVELKRDGDGPLYYAMQSTNFSLEEFIPRAGLELKAERRYWKLTPRDQSTTAAGSKGQVVDIDIEAYDRTPLAQNEHVPSGTLVEVELLVESKNDYEYLLLEDRKPAGFETVEGLSGYRPGFGGAYVEFRDDRVAMFFRRLNRGTQSVIYRVRAEQPGAFSALPARIEAMYSPSLVGNSDEQKIGVSELVGQ